MVVMRVLLVVSLCACLGFLVGCGPQEPEGRIGSTSTAKDAAKGGTSTEAGTKASTDEKAKADSDNSASAKKDGAAPESSKPAPSSS